MISERVKNALAKNICKDDLAEFSGQSKKLKKAEIVEHFFKTATNNDIKRLCKAFPDETALRTDQVADILGCKKNEVTRWINEGKLRVLCKEEFRKFGQYFEANLIDSCQVLFEITPTKIVKWREAHDKQTKKNRAMGAKKASETRKKNKSIRTQAKNELEEMKKEWLCVSEEACLVMTLAYWTMWISRWAKKYQELKDYELKKSFYKLKNEGIELLVKSQYADISFYRPEDPDKKRSFWVSYDIEDHSDDYFYDEEEDDDYRELITEVYPDYYSLYYLRIYCDTSLRNTFSFHTPYDIGKDFFPAPDSLKMVDYKEQEGMFRFGRTVDEDEMISHPEKTVYKNFKAAYDALQKYYCESEMVISR